MKEWLTAQEIAAEELPSLPRTERAFQIMAERDGWNANAFYARRRTGRGGGWEYTATRKNSVFLFSSSALRDSLGAWRD